MKAATLLAFALAATPISALANVITDWDDIAVKRNPTSRSCTADDCRSKTFRAQAIVDVAMFNAVDCIEPKYGMLSRCNWNHRRIPRRMPRRLLPLRMS